MSDIVERLRGIYRIPVADGLGAVGGGEEPENPTEFVRKFETPPIQHEAANEIEALRRLANSVAAQADALEARAERAEAECEKLREALKPLAEKFLYPDDLGFEHADDIRSDEDWDEDANDMKADDSFTLRRDIRRARKALAKKEDGE